MLRKDYYNLFPGCEKCHQHRLNLKEARNYAREINAEAAYSRHLWKDHNLTREEIAGRTGAEVDSIP